MQRGIERADVAHQRAAGLGGQDIPGAALELRHAQAYLQVGQALAGRRQGQVLTLGAARDAEGLGVGQYEVEGGEVEAQGQARCIEIEKMREGWRLGLGEK